MVKRRALSRLSFPVSVLYTSGHNHNHRTCSLGAGCIESVWAIAYTRKDILHVSALIGPIGSESRRALVLW